jgi:autotransporter strand-loop-strand O-heptosyltransferase
MFKQLNINATFNERTGYGIHGSRFFSALNKLHEEKKTTEYTGEVHISLLDTVTASQKKDFPPFPSILYNVWESSSQPDAFIKNLQYYSQLWVASEAQKAWSISQGIPEEFIRVIPEGVDPDIYFPVEWTSKPDTFNFVHVGQFQYRKSTKEICECFLKAFPEKEYPNVRLYLSVDTLFPSDKYKTTEERLAAYGFTDPRFIIVHFEERADYIKRLQTSHVFVSCSRSEGFYLPGIESMACGIPTILANYGGSTEYGEDALLVNVPGTKKPQEIYGNWDVPGVWGEPDYNHLVEVMKDAYDNYDAHRVKAIRTSHKIRDKFSWQRAAEKAFEHLKQLHSTCVFVTKDLTKPETNTIENLSVDPEKEIRLFAQQRGYQIGGLSKEKAIFVVGTWPNSQEKLDTLQETVFQIKQMGYPILISTHYALPAPIVELADYVLYEKNNVLSGEWRAEYVRVQGEDRDVKKSRIPYHGVACLNAIRNAVDFCSNRYDRMFYIEYDCETDVEKFVKEALASDKPMTCVDYEGVGIRTDIFGGDVRFLNNIPYCDSWEEYIKDMENTQTEYPLEMYLYKHLPIEGLNIIKFDTYNRFDQVDRELWEDDMFAMNYLDGPCFNISGISNRVYDVSFCVGDKNVYTVQRKVGMWSKATPKFYLPWEIKCRLNGEVKYETKLDLKGKRVLIQMGSKALGDTIAWIPYVEEFRKKHECTVLCSGWWQEILDYPEIEFIKPGSEIKDVTASYTVGCFDDQLDKNPINWRDVPLQKVATDILGLEYVPMRAKLKRTNQEPINVPYVTFSEFSTMRSKMWNRDGAWQNISNHLRTIGYEPVSISYEPSQLTGITKRNGQAIQQTIELIANSQFYIGLNHGPAWIAYALGKPVIMLTGVSEEWNDFPNPYRIAINNDVCGKGCFNDTTYKIDRGFEWCPRGKNFICTREITEGMVTATISRLIEDTFREVPDAAEKGKKPNKRKHKGNDKVRAFKGAVDRLSTEQSKWS